MSDTKEKVSNNVQSLIDRLRDDGIKAGNEEAQKLISSAEQKASEIVHKAKEEASRLNQKAVEDIRSEREAANEALRIALRDAQNMLREQVTSNFAVQLKRMISQKLKDTSFLKEMILAVAGRVAKDINMTSNAEVLLSQAWLQETEPSEQLEVAQKEQDTFIAELTKEMVNEGIAINIQEMKASGFKIFLKDQEIELDLTDDALSEMILKYLSPRFRALLSGVM